MATYAEVINNNGKIIIDDSTARLCRTRTLALTPGIGSYSPPAFTTSAFGISGISAYAVQLSSNEKFIAVRALNGHDNVAVMASGISDGVFRVFLVGEHYDSNTHADDYLVDVYGYVPNRTYNNGLQIFNASGERIFESNEHYMNVQGVYLINTSQYTMLKTPSQFPHTLNIGVTGMSLDKNSIAIGSFGRQLAQDDAEYYPTSQAIYGVRFKSDKSIDLVLRYSMLNAYDGGIGAYTGGHCNIHSGIVLNHENIASRNDGTLALIN